MNNFKALDIFCKIAQCLILLRNPNFEENIKIIGFPSYTSAQYFCDVLAQKLLYVWVLTWWKPFHYHVTSLDSLLHMVLESPWAGTCRPLQIPTQRSYFSQIKSHTDSQAHQAPSSSVPVPTSYPFLQSLFTFAMWLIPTHSSISDKHPSCPEELEGVVGLCVPPHLCSPLYPSLSQSPHWPENSLKASTISFSCTHCFLK